VTECPVEAIMAEDDVLETQQEFIELNRSLAAKWPVITTMKPAPQDADEWKNVSGKRAYLEE